MSDRTRQAETQQRFVQANAERARDMEVEARRHLEQAEKARVFWEDLLRHLSAGHSASALLVLRRGKEDGIRLDYLDEPSYRFLEQLREDCEMMARDAAIRFGRAFPEAARDAGLHIDVTSRQPRYTFDQGFIQVDVDDRHFTAKVETRDGAATILGLDIVPLVNHVKAERSRLFDREFQPEKLLRRIHRAYLGILDGEGRPPGEEIPLRRVTSRLAKNLNRFAADEFNIDLSRLLRSNTLVIDGQRLHLNHSRNTRQGMLLHGLEQGGYVGFISFKKEGGA